MLATKKSVNSVNISSKEDDKYWCGEFFSRYAQHQLNLLVSLTVCIFLSLVTEMSITRHSPVRRHALESDALESDCLFKLVKLNCGSKQFITWINKLTPTQSRIVTSECGSKSQMVYAETLVLQAWATAHTTTLKHRSIIHCQIVEMA